MDEPGCLGLTMTDKEMRKEITELRAEVQRLHKVIAQDLSENDELGSEYTYVNALKGELKEFQAENKSLRKTIGDRLSCCCSGCSRHNQNVMDQPCDEKNDLL